MSNIDEFIKLIENEEFEEAHEVLEHDWLRYKKLGEKEKALFLKGLINGATSIALHIRKRSLRARTITWDAFLRHKPLLDELNIEKTKYLEAIELIEEKYKIYAY